MIERYGYWIIRWRYLIILATLVLVALSTLGFPLKFDTDYRVFFSEDNPQLLAFDELENTYTKNDSVILVLAPKNGQVFTNETLEAVEWLTRATWQIPYSIRVDSITNFQYSYAEEDDIIVEDLISDAKNLSIDEIARVKEIALQESQLINRLISTQAHVTGINVTLQLPGKQAEKEMPEVVTYVRDLADKVRRRYPHLDVYITGIVVMNNTMLEVAQQETKTLLPVMYLVILIMLWLLLRTFSGMFVTLLIISFSTVSAMGLTGLLGITLSSGTSFAPVIILTLAVADCVHLLVTLRDEMRTQRRIKHDAIVESLRVNFQPIFLTSLTTVIGFLSLNFGEVPPYRDLGNIVAMGVTIAFFLSITLLPALMAILPLRTQVQSTVHSMDRLGDFVVARQRTLMWGMASLIVLLVCFLPRNELNDDIVKDLDESLEFRRATDFVAQNLTGLYDIHYSLSAGQPGGVSDPLFLHKVDEFAEWLGKQPEVKHVNSITDIFKRLNKNMHGDDPNYYHLPEQQDLAAQYLLFFEMSLPYGLDVNNQINVDKSATRVTITTKVLSANEILALEKRIQEWLKENALPSVAGTSTTIMFANISYRNIRSLLFGATLALVLISLILIVALRSIKFGLISLIPNLVPAAMAFGLWGMTVGEIGLGLSVVTGLTLGLVVDDTIYFLSNYLRARREKGLTPPEAVRYTFRSVGLALWFTSVILIAGFLLMLLSLYNETSNLGIMVTIIIIFALIADFFFLPPLLMKVDK